MRSRAHVSNRFFVVGLGALLLAACGGSAQLDVGSDRADGGASGASRVGNPSAGSVNRGGTSSNGGASGASTGGAPNGGAPSGGGASAGTGNEAGSPEGGGAGEENVAGVGGEGGSIDSPCNPIRFADPNLELVLRNSIGNHTTDITPAQANGVLYVNAAAANVSYLGGIECFPNISTMYLSENPITDLSEISALKKLELLDLSLGSIADFGPLRELPALKFLQLDQFKRALTDADFTAIAQVPKLQSLTLTSDTFGSFAPLAASHTLGALYFDSGHAGDPASIALLTTLYSLAASSTNLQVADLAALTQLEDLDFESNHVTDISALAPLVKMQGINLDNNAITDLSPLAGMVLLSEIDMNANHITDLTPLEGLPYLSVLDLQENKIKTVAPLVQNFGLISTGMVYLWENPLDCQAEQSNLEALAANHVTVQTDCPFVPFP